MIDVFDETKDKDSPNGARELGWLSAQLVEALARQAGEPTPRILKTNVSFLNEELKGFDTVEARERREQALIETLRDLMGQELRQGSKRRIGAHWC